MPLKPTGERRQAGEAEQLSRFSERSALGLDVTLCEFDACIIDDGGNSLAAQRQPAVQCSAIESQMAGKPVARASPGGERGEYQLADRCIDREIGLSDHGIQILANVAGHDRVCGRNRRVQIGGLQYDAVKSCVRTCR